MQYASGGTLFKLLFEKLKIEEKYVKVYAAELIVALEALHEKGMAYQDLMPENILLDQNGHLLLRH